MYKSLLTICIIFSSCSFISRSVNNVRKPTFEDEESIVKWVKKQNINYDEIVTLDTLNYYDNLIKLDNRKAYIFTQKGEFISWGFSDSTSCYKLMPEILATLEPITENVVLPKNYFVLQYKVNNSVYNDTIILNLREMYKDFRDFNGKSLTFLEESYDYVVLFPIAKFFGNTFQLSDTKKNIRAIKSNNKSKIKIVLVNLDKQKWWSSTAKERIKLII